ncbi:MAG: HAD-IB family hydrolase [Acidimicrobiia bacterium]|nr:HAD-IB family hydrolase [Acidimicrobiia bacterium]
MSQRAAAFFDLDRTIIGGSSVFTFGWVAYRRGFVPTRQLVNDAVNAVMFKFAGASDDKTEAVKQRILEAIEGVEVTTLTELADEIIPRLLDGVRREARGLIDLHADAGRDTYIVSASPVEIVARFAEEMGMTGGLGTVSEVVDGVYTGDLAEPFCYGEGKADAVRRIAAEQGYDLSRSYAYTDSAGDLPMLEAVGHPVAVNPDRALETVAFHRGWPVVEFSRTKKKVIKRTTAGVGATVLAATAYVVGRRQGRRLGPKTRRQR